MTEPTGEPEIESSASGPTPAEPPMQAEPAEPAASAEPPTSAEPPIEAAPTDAAPPPASGWVTPQPPPAPSATGWVAPEGGGSGGRRRGCIILVIVAGVLLVFGFLGLIFLGNQALSLLGGTIQFGTGGSGCSVTGAATSFPASASIHSVAYLERKITAGETVTTMVTFADGTTDSTDQTFDSAADCVTQEIAPGLDPGHYGLEYRTGTELLAKGGFDITP